MIKWGKESGCINWRRGEVVGIDTSLTQLITLEREGWTITEIEWNSTAGVECNYDPDCQSLGRSSWDSLDGFKEAVNEGRKRVKKNRSISNDWGMWLVSHPHCECSLSVKVERGGVIIERDEVEEKITEIVDKIEKLYESGETENEDGDSIKTLKASEKKLRETWASLEGDAEDSFNIDPV